MKRRVPLPFNFASYESGLMNEPTITNTDAPPPVPLSLDRLGDLPARIGTPDYDEIRLVLGDALSKQFEAQYPFCGGLFCRQAGKVREERVVEPRKNAATGLDGQLGLKGEYGAVAPANFCQLLTRTMKRLEA